MLSSLAAQTQANVAQLTLPAGTYIVKSAIQTTNTPSDSQIDVTIGGLSCSNCNKKQSVVAKTSNVYNGVTMHVKITSNTTLTTEIWSTSAINGTIYGELSAIRIA